MEIRFIGEKKEGPPEKELEDALGRLFTTVKEVRKAYLAIAGYADGLPPKVVLCVSSLGTQDEDANLVAKIGQNIYPDV